MEKKNHMKNTSLLLIVILYIDSKKKNLKMLYGFSPTYNPRKVYDFGPSHNFEIQNKLEKL